MLIVSIGSIWIATASPIVIPSRARPFRSAGAAPRRSVQPFLDLLEERGGAVPLGAAAGAAQELLEGRDGGAVIVAMRMQQPGLAPQLDMIGRKEQHILDDRPCLVELLALHQAQVDVV